MRDSVNLSNLNLVLLSTTSGSLVVVVIVDGSFGVVIPVDSGRSSVDSGVMGLTGEAVSNSMGSLSLSENVSPIFSNIEMVILNLEMNMCSMTGDFYLFSKMSRHVNDISE